MIGDRYGVVARVERIRDPGDRDADDRYKVTRTPCRTRFVITDFDMWADCALPNEDGELVPLEWNAAEQAQAWLQRCYLKWHERPKVGKPHPAPIGLT